MVTKCVCVWRGLLYGNYRRLEGTTTAIPSSGKGRELGRREGIL